ncbi:MAG: glycosyltransferase [Muribaculaceae bacterium]
MRILQVITSLRIGGAEKLIAEISPMLRDMGHQVDVLAFDGVETHFTRMLRDKGIKVLSFGTNCNVYNPLFVLRLARMMRRYDIVHTHNTAPQIFAAIAGVLCSVVLVTTEHTTSNRRRDWKWYARIDRWMYRQYRKVICISDKAEENLRAAHPSLRNLCTVYNGVDVQAFHNAQPIASMQRDGLTHIIMVAGFRYQKDQDTAIKALARLDRSSYALWLAGDGKRRAELQALAAAEGVADRVAFLGVRDDIPQLLQSADIVVMSSHFEGLSLSSVEGMSVGKPFVASNVDGLHEVVAGHGLLFPHGDDKALADIIERLASDRALYDEVADRCWQRAQMFDIHKMAENYNQVYNNLL